MSEWNVIAAPKKVKHQALVGDWLTIRRGGKGRNVSLVLSKDLVSLWRAKYGDRVAVALSSDKTMFALRRVLDSDASGYMLSKSGQHNLSLRISESAFDPEALEMLCDKNTVRRLVKKDLVVDGGMVVFSAIEPGPGSLFRSATR